MSDNRINDYAGQYQIALEEKFQDYPLGQRPLLKLANQNVIPTAKGSNEFRIFSETFRRGNVSTLEAHRSANTGNILTSDPTIGGQIPSQARNLRYEDFKLDVVFTDAHEVDLSLGIDNPVNSVEKQTKFAHKTHSRAFDLFVHELLLAQAVNADEWITGVQDLVIVEAITAGATTFKVSNEDAENIEVERFVKIGNKRNAFDDPGLDPAVDVVMVDSVGAADSGGSGLTLITIEDDSANFPKGYHFDGQGEIFKSLKTSLSEHKAGVRVQIDKPIALTEENVDKELVRKIRTKAKRSYITPNGLLAFMPPEVSNVMESEKTPFVANEFLGKDVLTDGRIGRIRGIDLVDEADSVSRVMSDGSIVHYVWVFERYNSFAYKEFLKSRALGEVMQGRAGMLLKDSYFYNVGAHTPRDGAIRAMLVPVSVPA